ncbi:MAG: hypothetical protein CTY35_00235 [Methylotenera sp.]|uniref:ParM/StbA family protein n=1 Tax=Methylotenera sp. TaxID=2051956 RepID=UPI000D479439|nr:ParM/StbA family protein [Methylotenera sp.]PPC84783.1 MAG: hypothetical protein CTY38_00235 [Methylotenera sp.]PPD02142.1 MAG: hypothetical protein CTY35_00235 [Methylotenera sp.]
MVKNQAPCVGIDDGRACVKVYGGKGKQFKIRTSVKAGLHAGSTGLGGAGIESGAYEADKLKYTVGDRVEGEDTRFEDFDGSAINRVAIHHALIRAGFAGQQIKIATGLPVNAYYSNGSINDEYINKKRSLIAQPVSSLTEGLECAKIISNVVCSEALSAWLDDVLNEDGSIKKNANMEHPCGVVDFGGRTTDTLWINPPETINHARSGSESIGVLDLFDLISIGIRRKFDVSDISRNALEVAASTGIYRFYGEDKDVKDVVDEAADEICNRIDREIQRRFGNAAELDRILFVGGGAAALPQIANRYKNAVRVEDPEFANARGMYKFLKHCELGK